MQVHSTLSGRYRLVIDHEDNSTTDTGWFKNKITDQGLNSIGDHLQSAASIYWCALGGGSSTPSAGNTTLDAQIGSAVQCATTTTSNTMSPNYDIVMTFKFVFDKGAIIGNISEVGVGWLGAANSPLRVFSRSLITDSGGLPVTVTATSVDKISIFYELTMSASLAVSSGSIVVGGVTYNYVARRENLRNVGSADIFFQTSGGIPASQYLHAARAITPQEFKTESVRENSFGPVGYTDWKSIYGSSTLQNYVQGSFVKDQVFTADTDFLNCVGGTNPVNGFDCIVITSWRGVFAFTYLFDKVIPKDNTKTFTITFRTSWGTV